ncbi:MAG: apolipoprotein N-acyltransferase [Gammaproteobacteria bacterium]|nr:apolipoprotein N-acyltransferase [Gammaproteobacteria bacterium]MBU1655254.1 apolipoprotein N-acyltransferase [Gammaproteobacteria bacterium]MBU1962033.1 apolipoprotein N-acyltransferase [Gammaproteobacteria bacterium]
MIPPRLRFLPFLLCGALGVLAFAPFEWRPLLPIGLAFLFFHLVRLPPRAGFFAGYAYGLGLMGAGVSWLQISLDLFAEVGFLASILFTLAFVAFIALYFGLAGWLIARLASGRGGRGGLGLLGVAPAVWILVEWLRGWFLTGFPWLGMGYATLDTPLAGYAPLLGVYGLGWLLALLAGALALMFSSALGVRAILAAMAGVILLGGWGLQPLTWSQTAGEAIKVSLVQANIAQTFKWDPDQFGISMKKHLELTAAHWDSDLIIWPETAVSAYEHTVRPFLLDPLESDAREHNSEVLLGVPIMDFKSDRYYNAMLRLGKAAPGIRTPAALPPPGLPEVVTYYKRHLVPIGEYAPFRSLLKPLIDSLGIPMSDFIPGTAGKPLLRVAGYQAGISICYEDAFGAELIQALPEAAFLINASNDGWFGDSIAPHQHLEIARLRALETGRYLLKSTNTGISAVIGPDGQVLERSPLLKEHVLTHRVIPLQGLTPYARLGNWPVLGLLGLLLAGLMIIGRAVPGTGMRRGFDWRA